MKSSRPLLRLVACVVFGYALPAADWPMWRHDPNRTARSDERLPDELAPRWSRSYGARVQVWDDPFNHDLMPYDRLLEPIVQRGRVFIGFNDRDKLVALDLGTGCELWAFYADGPVRLAPAAWQDRVYFASDDGCLYCVSAEDGALVWKFRGAPSGRKALGNRRVISAWPARGGPVIRDGVVYFAASIWPFMGTFIHALDAATGRVIWTNDGTGAHYIRQPHSAPAFAGVAPQGSLVATERRLIVPGGRSVPAVFDRQTGEFLYFHINDGGKGTGGSFVIASESEFFVHTRGRGVLSFDLATGRKGTFALNEPVLDGPTLFAVQDHPATLAKLRSAEGRLPAAEYAVTRARSRLRTAEHAADPAALTKAHAGLTSAEQALAKARDAIAELKRANAGAHHGPVVQALDADRQIDWELPVDAAGDLIRAGNRLYAGSGNRVLAIAPPENGASARIVWSHAVDGEVARLLAASGHLLAVTLEGGVHAFAAGAAPVESSPGPRVPIAIDPAARERARAILAATDTREGYALCFGVADATLLDALIAESELHFTAVDPDGSKVEALRRRYDAAGWYGTRVAVHAGTPATYQAPPYIASVVVIAEATGRVDDPDWLPRAWESVRPYGGVLWLDGLATPPSKFLAHGDGTARASARLAPSPHGTAIVRAGPLPGAADWTHQYGSAANPVKSDDRLVRLPLGVLWFGGTSNADVLPRHGHGPSEQVVGGRLFIEGMNCLSARDVYTGRVLWKTEIPGLDTFGVYWDDTYLDVPVTTLYSQVHIPGANARGTNYVATENEVYVAARGECHVLDSRTGRILRAIRLPLRAGETQPPDWGFLAVHRDVLLGGAGFAHYSRTLAAGAPSGPPPPVDLSASAGLVAFDRHSGAVLWRTEARHSFWHNGIVAGNGRVFCLDRLPKSAEDKLRRRGVEPPSDYRIVALDLRTGRALWESTTEIFGTWLGYSEKHDRLLQAGASASDRLGDEAARGMIVYDGTTGAVAWRNPELAYNGPCILHGDLIITSANSYRVSSGAFRLLDGQPHLVPNPLTGNLEPWRVHRTYGCNYVVASEHLLTFRAGAAGFYDLEHHTGTGSLGGFKSGCSPNLIVANGVLNAPDYTRTCSCAYQNQTSLAFVHMPELELWTYNLFGSGIDDAELIARLGLNLGAPGDRRSETGTLWLEYPFVGGASPGVGVTLKPAQPAFYRRHASQLSGEGPAWVFASGVRNLESLTLSPLLGRTSPPPSGKSSDDDDDAEKKARRSEGKAERPAAAPAPIAAAPVAAAPVAAAPRAPGKPRLYTVRLYFAEPDELAAGQRVFDVAVAGRVVLRGLDIAREAGGVRRGIVREVPHVRVDGDLTMEFTPAPTSAHPPVLAGIELIAEERQEVARAH